MNSIVCILVHPSHASCLTCLINRNSAKWIWSISRHPRLSRLSFQFCWQIFHLHAKLPWMEYNWSESDQHTWNESYNCVVIDVFWSSALLICYYSGNDIHSIYLVCFWDTDIKRFDLSMSAVIFHTKLKWVHRNDSHRNLTLIKYRT